MTNKLFDSFVKDKLQDHQSKVPDDLWDKIIAEDERKPIAFWWWNKYAMLVGLVLLLSIAGITYYSFNIKNNKQLAASTENKTNANDENKLDQNSNVKESNTATSNNEYSLNKEVDNNNISTTTNSSKLNETVANNEFESSKNKNLITNNKIDADNNKLAANENTVANTSLNTNNKFGNKSFGKLLNNKQKQFNQKNKLLNNFTVGLNNDEKELPEASVSQKMFAAGNIANIENNLYKTNSLKDAKVLAIAKLFKGSDDCPSTRGVFRKDFYIEGYASPDFSFKTVSSTKAGNDNYLHKKDSSETMRVGFTIGARFSKSITNNLLLKAGVQYSQFNEKFTLRTENDRRQIIVINSHTITRPGLPDTTISDTSTSLQIGYRVRSNINRYKNLEIPVLLSYELSEQESKWKMAINAGAIVNITSWYEGRTLDSTNNLVNLGSKSSNGFYQNKIGVSLYAGITILRNITEDLDVFAEPYFRYGLLNNMQSNSGFSQKFSAVGLQFGARLRLSKAKHL